MKSQATLESIMDYLKSHQISSRYTKVMLYVFVCVFITSCLATNIIRREEK